MAQQGMNLASRYAEKVDERFVVKSQAALALNNDYKFQGVQTVNVYSVPTVPLVNYTRSGSNRFGTPTDLQNNVQELKVTRDRAFAFVIDKGNKTQSQMVFDAGRALDRQLRQVVIPEYDAYAFYTLAKAATANGNTDTTAATKANAYKLFLDGQEALGDYGVPDEGRVCFCSYAFANLLKQDPAFMLQSDRAKAMVDRGVIGEVDGVRIVKVPKTRLPSGADYILTHPIAACGPKQLEDYNIHDNPQGYSGWVVEGRVIYDCFVLDQKLGAVYYHGAAVTGSFTPPLSSTYGTGGWAAYTTAPTNPKTAGAYEYSSATGQYVLTADTTAASGKTYYRKT